MIRVTLGLRRDICTETDVYVFARLRGRKAQWSSVCKPSDPSRVGVCGAILSVTN